MMNETTRYEAFLKDLAEIVKELDQEQNDLPDNTNHVSKKSDFY